MKASKVLLRWYKSFNVNYTQYSDFGAKSTARPWNTLGLPSASDSDLPFIEISLESDITTIVGANESGKSHLLSAISKVVNGTGLPDGSPAMPARIHVLTSATIHPSVARTPMRGLTSDWSLPICRQTTSHRFQKCLKIEVGCRASVIRLHWSSHQTERELRHISIPKTTKRASHSTLTDLQAFASAYREIRFIQSKAELSDDIHVADVLSHFGISIGSDDDNAAPCYPLDTLLQIVDVVRDLVPGADNKLSADSIASLSSAKSMLTKQPQKNMKGSLGS